MGKVKHQGGLWSNDEWAVAHAYQRHLLELSTVDKLIGQLLTRLRETGLWDKAVIMITADHGVSFKAGDNRRLLSGTNFADILGVPFFVRAPGLKADQISDAAVQNIDVLPTIADLLNVELKWDVFGKSVFDPSIEQWARCKFLRVVLM